MKFNFPWNKKSKDAQIQGLEVAFVQQDAEPYVYEPADDQREAFCPNCSSGLTKVPGAKTKCPHCSRYIFVRTTPDRRRILVGEDDLESVDDEIAKANGTWDERLRLKVQRARVESDLTEKWGHSPSPGDLEWAILGDESMYWMSKGELSMLHTIYGNQVRFLFKENRYANALPTIAWCIGFSYVQFNLQGLDSHHFDDLVVALEKVGGLDSKLETQLKESLSGGVSAGWVEYLKLHSEWNPGPFTTIPAVDSVWAQLVGKLKI
jgi:hypothetical protein